MQRVTFEAFELNLDDLELRRGGAVVKVQPQPLRVLAYLVAHRGVLVTREELQTAIWGSATFVDFDRGLNFCIAQLRAALGDSAETPRFIQTIPRRGYRFIAPVQAIAEAAASRRPKTHWLSAAAVAALAGLVVVGVIRGIWLRQPPTMDRSNDAVNAQARSAYLAGQYLERKGSNDDLWRALDHFRTAIDYDPRFSAAHTAFAETSITLVMARGANPRELLPKARIAAAQSLQINPGDARAEAALGAVLFWHDWDIAAARPHFLRAVKLDATLGTAHHDYGWLLIAARQFEDGLNQIRQAQRLEPLSPRTALDLAWAFLRTGRYADAIEQSRRALDLEPSYLDAEACLELALALDGRPAEALTIARHLLERLAPAVDAGIEVGDPARSLARVRSIRLSRLETEPFVGRVGPYMIGAQHALLEHRDQALEWLERAYVERAPMMVLLGLDPAFASLHGDERFASLVDRIARK